MRNLDGRLRRLERTADSDEAVLRAWECAGRLYCELDEAERELFCRFWKFGTPSSFEEMYADLGWPLDFPVFAEKRYTLQEWREKVAEIEAYMMEEIDKNERM